MAQTSDVGSFMTHPKPPSLATSSNLSTTANTHGHTSQFALTFGAIGVVYGDIGTSVLYSVKEVFSHGGLAWTTANVYGVFSLFIWTLMIIVSLKYVTLVLRADNHGEGGLVAMLALAMSAIRQQAQSASMTKLYGVIMLLGIFGTCLFYGDGVITPAISVLSAVEGLAVVSPHLAPWVMPLTLVILFALFFVQRFGTQGIGRFFAPIMVLWFAAIAGIGVYHIAHNPAIIAAINPLYALMLMTHAPWTVFLMLGAVVLCVTGGEALYADMGHFGKRPIRLAWFGLVLPALVLNYLGQGAFLLANPTARDNPFFLMIPETLRVGMVVLATLATVIASQALISGAFSITKQVVQLGLLPRLRIVYTNAKSAGQIYVPAVNWGLFVAIVLAVALFKTSSALAAAYGIAVCTDMLITTILTFFVIRYAWRYPLALCVAATAFFVCIDGLFWASNLLKLPKGGWFPLLLGAGMFVLMTTWRDGRALLSQAQQRTSADLREYLAQLYGGIKAARLQNAVQQLDARINKLALMPAFADSPLSRDLDRQYQHLQEQHARYHKYQPIADINIVEGVAVFLVAKPDIVPLALTQNLKHNKVLHHFQVFVCVKTHDVPWIGLAKRSEVVYLGNNCWQVLLNYGFKNDIDVPAALRHVTAFNFNLAEQPVSYFLSQIVVKSPAPKKQASSQTGAAHPLAHMARWRKKLFAHMQRNAGNAVEYFKLPSNQVVELGVKVDI